MADLFSLIVFVSFASKDKASGINTSLDWPFQLKVQLIFVSLNLWFRTTLKPNSTYITLKSERFSCQLLIPNYETDDIHAKIA